MRYIYPDTSIWNRLCDQTADPRAFYLALEERDVGLTLGFNVLYEIAKQFFSGTSDGAERGRELFSYAQKYLDLHVPIVKENWALLVEEALDVVGDRQMSSCFRNEQDYGITIREIDKLCRGDISPETARFFESRKSAARTSRFEMKAQLESRADLKAFLDGISEESLPHFLDAATVGPQGTFLLLGHLRREFPKNSVSELANVANHLLKSPRYRASRAMTRSGLYLNWRCAKRGSIRSDLPDDTFHVVSAAYCAVFATTEADQATIARHSIRGIQAVVCNAIEPVSDQLLRELETPAQSVARA